MEFWNGDIYEGQWVHNQQHGIGYKKENNQSYSGSWHKDIRQGRGTLYDNDGKIIYEGDWSDDKFHGQGRYYNRNGNVIF